MAEPEKNDNTVHFFNKNSNAFRHFIYQVDDFYKIIMVIHKWRHGLGGKRVNNFVTTNPLYLKACRYGKKVTFFVYEPLLHYYNDTNRAYLMPLHKK